MKFHLKKKANLTTKQEAIVDKIIEALGSDDGLVIEYTEDSTGGSRIRVVGKYGEVNGTTPFRQSAADILRFASTQLPMVVKNNEDGGFWSSIKIDDIVELFELVEVTD